MSRNQQMSRSPQGQGQGEWYSDVLEYLTPDLVDFLADLHEAPSSLVATGLAVLKDATEARSDQGRLQLTSGAFAVMAEAAARKERREISCLAARARAVASDLSRP